MTRAAAARGVVRFQIAPVAPAARAFAPLFGGRCKFGLDLLHPWFREIGPAKRRKIIKHSLPPAGAPEPDVVLVSVREVNLLRIGQTAGERQGVGKVLLNPKGVGRELVRTGGCPQRRRKVAGYELAEGEIAKGLCRSRAGVSNFLPLISLNFSRQFFLSRTAST